MSENRQRIIGVIVFLSAIILFQGFALRRWVTRDTRPLAWDQAIHMKASLDYRSRIEDGRWRELLKPAHFNYPPFYHLLVGATFGATADGADAGAFVNFFFFILLVFSVYLLARDLLGPWPAVTAATLVTCYPIMMDLCRQTMTDYALTAVVGLTVLCLLRSKDFSSLRWSLAFGLTFGLSLLVKWTAFMYVAGPFVYVAWHAARKRNLRLVFGAAVVSALVAGPWYVVNLIPMLSRIVHTSNLPPASGLVLSGALQYLWYAVTLPEQLNLIFLLLLVPGLVAVFRRPNLWPVWLWFVVSLALFTLLHNRNTRYAMPALPAAAILSVAWLPLNKRLPFVAINAVAATFFLLYQFFPGRVPALRLGSMVMPLVDSKPAIHGDWKHNEIIARVMEVKEKERFSKVVTLSNYPEFHGTTINLSAHFQRLTNVAFVGPSKRRWLEFADFILLKTGDIGPEATLGTIRPLADFVSTPPPWFQVNYRERGRWDLPDGSQAILFHLEPKGEKTLDVGLFNLTLDEFRIPNMVMRKMSLTASPLSPEQTARGALKDVVLRCEALEYKGIQLNDVQVRLERPRILVPVYLETQELMLSGLEAAYPSVTLNAETVLAYLAKKAKWLSDPRVEFSGSRILVQGKASGIPLQITMSLTVARDVLSTRLVHVRVAKIPLPLIFLRAETDRDIPLTPNRQTPFHLKIRAIQGEGQKLRIIA